MFDTARTRQTTLGPCYSTMKRSITIGALCLLLLPRQCHTDKFRAVYDSDLPDEMSNSLLWAKRPETLAARTVYPYWVYRKGYLSHCDMQ